MYDTLCTSETFIIFVVSHRVNKHKIMQTIQTIHIKFKQKCNLRQDFVLTLQNK